MMNKRQVKIAVISDIHLGTYGCRAKEVLRYLKSIDPEVLILNGDIVDIWQFSKKYFPKTHMKVVRYILKMAGKGTPVYYITGNHDEMMRKFADMDFGNIRLVNKLTLDIEGKKTSFFHGDVFDFSIQHAKWLAKLGGTCYDALIVLNTFVNYLSEKMGGKRISLSKKIKMSVKQALSFINDFEQACARYAISEQCNTVVCGHIHQACLRTIKIGDDSVQYLNSGDWVESLTALEFNEGAWSLYHYMEDAAMQSMDNEDEEEIGIQHLLREFNIGISNPVAKSA
jgi:UDP-2,3-diacylglucosamine pyrophosphatase LpxH